MPAVAVAPLVAPVVTGAAGAGAAGAGAGAGAGATTTGLGVGARLASMAGRMGSRVGQVAQKVAPHLDKVQTVRGAMDPAMKKLKEKQQERAQKEAMERQRMAETQNRQQMVADTSGSTTTGFDY
mgnify:CR=1 FL=1